MARLDLIARAQLANLIVIKHEVQRAVHLEVGFSLHMVRSMRVVPPIAIDSKI